MVRFLTAPNTKKNEINHVNLILDMSVIQQLREQPYLFQRNPL